MPSPLGHSLAGAAVAELFRHREGYVRSQAILMANVADLDMLPGLLSSRHPDAAHARASHSIGAALLTGASAGILARLRGRRFTLRFLQAAAAYGSHVLLDYLGKESDDGMPLLWPFSDRTITSTHGWFKTIRSYSRRHGFWLGLVNRSNGGALLREIGLLLPVYLVARRLSPRIGRRQGRRGQRRSSSCHCFFPGCRYCKEK